MKKRNDYRLAIKLRKKGKSYNFINHSLGIPKSTLVYWLRDEKWSQIIKEGLTKKVHQLARKQLQAMAKVNKKKWAIWREGFRNQATKEFNLLKGDSLFWSGIMLYWGEGDSKINNPVRMSNVTPEIICLFVKFLRKICKIPIEKLRLALILYPDLNETRCKGFWVHKTKIPRINFYKTQFIYGKHPTKKTKNGICMVIVNNRGLKEKIVVWQKMCAEQLLMRV